MSNCSKCGKKLGFLSGFVLGEKTFVRNLKNLKFSENLGFLCLSHFEY